MNILERIAIWILTRKGGENMMAMLYAINIIRGSWTYAKVPDYFKQQTKEHLIAMGAEDLIIE